MTKANTTVASDPFLKTRRAVKIILCTPRPIPMNGIILMKIIFCLLLFCSIGVHLNSSQALQPARWITVLSQLQFAKVFSIYLTPQRHRRSMFSFRTQYVMSFLIAKFSHRRDSVFFHSPTFFRRHIPHGQFIAPFALCRVTCGHPANFRPYGLGESTNFHWHDNNF